MTKDELLAGFLDRSLSEDRMLEFQALRSADPVFDKEVAQMLRLENVLATSAPVIIPPADFLVSVESTVAAKVASAASSSFFSGLMTSAWTWVTVGTVATIGAGALILTEPGKDRAQSEAATKMPAEVIAAPATQPTVSTPSITSSSATTNDLPVPLVRSQANRLAPPTVLDPSHDLGKLVSEHTIDPQSLPKADLSATKEEQILKKVIDDLKQCEERGDHQTCAQLSIEIGKKYRDQGNINEAQAYLNKALRHAQQSRIISYEIDAYGQLGLTALQAGQNDQAREYLTSAVELGESARVNVSKWQDHLRSLK